MIVTSAAAIHDADVVIIGAGQAGLSAAWHLRRRGLTGVVILDRGPSTGGAWQHRWESLRLDRAHRVHDLPGMDELGLSFDTADKTRPARDVVTEYYRRFEDAFDLHVRRPVTVSGVERIADAEPDDARFLVRTDVGTWRARIVVNASGTWTQPVRPEIGGTERFRGRQWTTPEFRDAADFAGHRVLVVGGGTSAIGFVLDLDEAGATVRWVTRRPPEFLPEDGLSFEHGRAAVADQDRAARAGLILPSIVSGTGVPLTERMRAGQERGVLVATAMIAELTETGARWSDGHEESFDDVIWATGFRAELGHLDPLGLRTDAGGIAVANGVAVEDDHVFLAGYGPQASTIGANRAGRALATAVVARLGADAVAAAAIAD